MKKRIVTQLFKKAKRAKEQGVALIVTLMVLLMIVLLTLSLLVQSDSEYVIAVNERDEADAFNYAEAGLSWAKREVLDFIEDEDNFSDLLNGPDNGVTTDDNLIPLRALDTTMTSTSELLTGNEQTASLKVNKNFGDGAKDYEVFRWGIDTDGDSVWDGPRALIYVRIDDNYDDTGTNDPLVDTDKRISATAIAEYPIFVDATGAQQSENTRTVGRKHLVAKFGNELLQPAILARRSLKIGGNPTVCGECGSIHANDNIYGGGDLSTCQDLTVSDSPIQFDDDGATIGDEYGGGFDEIEVPVINPYASIMVPEKEDFATMQDFAGLDCSEDTPKYFALVANNDKGLVFKAVWVNSGRPDNDDGGWGWKWKLIDDLNEGGNTRLDDCGRVVCGTVNGVSVHEVGDGTCNAGENWVNDDKDDEFYGFKLNDALTFTTACSGDISLSASSDIDENDFNTANFYCSSPNGFCATDNTIYSANYRLLPGGFDEDGIRDFADSAFESDKGRWVYQGNLAYSPVHNAVIWVYGNLELPSNPGEGNAKICTSTSSGVANKKCEESDSALLSAYGNYWRASFIAVGSIKLSGNQRYSTATPGYSFLLVAGRDIAISGQPDTSETICEPINGDECNRNLGNSAQFAGIIAAHEQMKNNGNYSFDGFMIIEDAVDCTTNIATRESSSGTPIDWSGNPNIHYDCEHPPNPWAAKVTVTSWQEVP